MTDARDRFIDVLWREAFVPVPDIRTRLADALDKHEGVEGWSFCRCSDKQKHCAGHLADVLLSLPGIAIVELPAPNQFAPDWKDFGHAQTYAALPGQVARFSGKQWITSSEARAIAAALLAAANATEV
jgi:hypothetical protein